MNPILRDFTPTATNDWSSAIGLVVALANALAEELEEPVTTVQQLQDFIAAYGGDGPMMRRLKFEFASYIDKQARGMAA